MLVLDPATKNLLIETIGASLSADQIEALGQMLIRNLNIHKLSGKSSTVTLSSRIAAQVLTEHIIENKRIDEFIKLLVEMDEENILGKEMRINELEYFLQKLSESGQVYDVKKRKIVPTKADLSVRPDWGALKSGRKYHVTVASMDVVGSSELVKKFGQKTMELFYSFFWTALNERLSLYNGRIWSWAGDGGLLAFAFKQHESRAVRFAIEMQRVMPLINTHDRNPIDEKISTRIGMHCGLVTFMSDTGKMISDVINLATHLEKKGTAPGSVSITKPVWMNLSDKLQSFFDPKGDFEDQFTLSPPERIDLI